MLNNNKQGGEIKMLKIDDIVMCDEPNENMALGRFGKVKHVNGKNVVVKINDSLIVNMNSDDLMKIDTIFE